MRPFMPLIASLTFLAACQPSGTSSSDKERQANLSDDRVAYRPNELLILPNDFQGVDGQFLTPEQIDEVRNHFSVNRNSMAISSVASDGCVSESDTFNIEGEGFGDSSAGHTVWLSMRSVDVGQAVIVSWSDTEIVARLPWLATAGRYNVGIKNSDGRYVSNRNRTLTHCPIEIPPVGVTAPEYVHPEMCFDLDPREGGLDYECTVGGSDCRVVDGDRVVHDFNHEAYNADSARQALFFLLDSGAEQQCIGPTPPPFIHPDGTLIRRHPPFMYFKKEGAIMRGGGGFRCRVPGEGIHGFSWEALEVRLSAHDGTWGIGVPEIHAGREFGFNRISWWETAEDARWVLYAHQHMNLRDRCGPWDAHPQETTFSYWGAL